MFRALWKLVVLVILAAFAGAAAVLLLSPNPRLTVKEWMSYPYCHQYDAIITSVAKKYDVDPMLVKAIVWHESSFRRDMIGKNGERGLMQVTEGAAKEWAKAQKVENFVPTDLFDAKTNLDAGTWYFKKSQERWKAKDDPLVFALAEYNAGHGRVQHWIEDSNMGKAATAADLLDSMTFPGTRAYIDSITSRRDFFKKRGRM
jgi:soluble lytic murein transglycosylase